MPLMDAGFEMLHGAVNNESIKAMVHELDNHRRPIVGGGLRNPEKQFPSIAKFLAGNTINAIARHSMGPRARRLRSILFVKTKHNNWSVPWHQDKTIAVEHRHREPGWGPWTVKDGLLHVQPPPAVLEQIISLRLHLDSANRENGCLKILPGTHNCGIIAENAITHVTRGLRPLFCEGSAGSMVIMKPLVLHASGKSQSELPRRVLHVEYTNTEFPGR